VLRASHTPLRVDPFSISVSACGTHLTLAEKMCVLSRSISAKASARCVRFEAAAPPRCRCLCPQQRDKELQVAGIEDARGIGRQSNPAGLVELVLPKLQHEGRLHRIGPARPEHTDIAREISTWAAGLGLEIVSAAKDRSWRTLR